MRYAVYAVINHALIEIGGVDRTEPSGVNK